MAIPFLTPVDMNWNEIFNMRLQNLPSHPSNPQKGFIYFNTTNNAPMAYNGTGWIDLSFLGDFIEKSTVTAKGDLIVGTANKTVSRLAKGTDGKILTADSSKATGLDWKAMGDMAPGPHASSHAPGGTDEIVMLAEATCDPVPDTLAKRDGDGLFDVGDLDTSAISIIWKYMLDDPLTSQEEDVYDNYKSVVLNVGGAAEAIRYVCRHMDEIMEGLLGASDAMIFKGVIDCSGNPDYPAATSAGHTYKVSVSGRIGGASGPKVEVGDMLICIEDDAPAGDHATVGSKWTIVQANIEGAVTGPTAAVSGNIATFDGTSGKLIKDSGLAVATSAPKADAATGAVGIVNRLAREDHVHPFATQPVNKGGTGLTSYAQGDLLYASAAAVLAKLPKSATAGHVLTNAGANNNPAWGKLKYTDLDLIPTSFAPSDHALASAVHTATAWRVFYSGADGIVTELALGAANTVLKSTGTSTAPTFAKVGYSELSGVPSSFAPASHVLASNTGLGSAHTISGATAGHVLIATGATEAKFAQLQWEDIGGKPAIETYTAGDGISLSSGVFSVAAGAGLVQEASGLKLGTPGTITATTANGVTAESHTHKITFPTTKYAADLSGSDTEHTVNHNLNSKDVIVSIYENSTGQQVYADVEISTVNAVKVKFATAQASNAYRVVVISG